VLNRKKFRLAYLHIGLGKTGSTAIQAQLLSLADRLERDHDLHFPVMADDGDPFRGNHSTYLEAMFVDGRVMSRLGGPAGDRSPQQIAERAEQVKSQFEAGFAASRAGRLLISAEAIGHFPKRSLQPLSQWLSEHVERVEIVACLRHPLAALSSEIQQRLKSGEVLEHLYEHPPFYAFQDLFDRIGAAFPASGLSLYDFSAATAGAGGVVGTFFRKIGLDAGVAVDSSSPANRSMSHEAALLLSALNKSRPMAGVGAPGNGRKPGDVLPFLSLPGPKFQAPPEVYAKLASRIQPDLAWLKQTHAIELDPGEPLRPTEYFAFSEEAIRELAVRVAGLHDPQA